MDNRWLVFPGIALGICMMYVTYQIAPAIRKRIERTN